MMATVDDVRDGRVFGGVRLWPTAVVLSLLVVGWFVAGWLSGDRAFVRSWWFPLLAALLVGWLHWSAVRSRVSVSGLEVSAGVVGRLEGPLRFADVIGVHGGGRGSTCMLLANVAGVGRRVRRPRWLPAQADEAGVVWVLRVPRLASTGQNRAMFVEVGARLRAAGVPRTGEVGLMFDRAERAAARSAARSADA